MASRLALQGMLKVDLQAEERHYKERKNTGEGINKYMNPPLLFTEHFNCTQLEDQHEDISKLSLPMLNGCRRQLVTFFQVHRLFLCIPLVTGQLCSRELLR